MTKPHVKSMTVEYYSDESFNRALNNYKVSKKWRKINVVNHRESQPGFVAFYHSGRPMYTIELER